MLRFLVVILLAGGVIAAGVWYQSRPVPVAVKLRAVDTGQVDSTVANTRVGTVKACRRAHLAPATGGQVSRLNVTEGSRVTGGAVLMEVWNADLRAQVDFEEAEVAAARLRVRETCLRAEGAEREARRLTRLRENNLVAAETADAATTEAESGRAACRAVEAVVRVSEARVEVARNTLDRTVVRAPFDGIVAEVNAELGEYVTPSPPGIATLPAVDLIDTSCIFVSAPIDEVDAPAIHVGQPACVSLDAFRDVKRCSGTVRRIAPYVLEREKQARTVEVEVEIKDPAEMEGLLPGYSADIEITLESRDGVPRVPTEAVLEGGGRVYVYRPVDGLLEERKFETGLSNWDYTEVKAGLRAGELVVVSIGKEGVKAGALATPES